MMEEERERVVQAYRKLKKQKQLQRDRMASLEKPKNLSWRSWRKLETFWSKKIQAVWMCGASVELGHHRSEPNQDHVVNRQRKNHTFASTVWGKWSGIQLLILVSHGHWKKTTLGRSIISSRWKSYFKKSFTQVFSLWWILCGYVLCLRFS